MPNGEIPKSPDELRAMGVKPEEIKSEEEIRKEIMKESEEGDREMMGAVQKLDRTELTAPKEFIEKVKAEIKPLAFKRLEKLKEVADIDVVKGVGLGNVERMSERELQNALDLLEKTGLDQEVIDKTVELDDFLSSKQEEFNAAHTYSMSPDHPLAIRREQIIKKQQDLEKKGVVKYNEETKKLEFVGGKGR